MVVCVSFRGSFRKGVLVSLSFTTGVSFYKTDMGGMSSVCGYLLW